MLWDTGSSDLLLPRTGCTTCATPKLFDSSKSSTFSPLPGTRHQVTFSTGITPAPLTAPQSASCLQTHDTITLGALTSKDQSFLLCDKYPDTFNVTDALDGMPIDGIMGLGPRSTSKTNKSFFWNLYDQGQLDSAVFSFWIPFDDVYLNDTQLTLGGIDHTRYFGPMNYTAFERPGEGRGGGGGGGGSDDFIITLSSISLDGKVFSITPTSAILDLGSPFIQTPDFATAQKLYAAISPLITQIDPAGAWGAPCNVLFTVWTDMTFRLGPEGTAQDLTIPRGFLNLNEYPGMPGICQALFTHPPVHSSGNNSWVIGSPLLKQYYTVWDPINMEIGWAQPFPFNAA